MHNNRFNLRRYNSLCKHQENVVEYETTKCEDWQRMIFECNEEIEEDENDNKNIDGQNATQYKEEEQTHKPDIETTCTNEMASE